MSPTNGLKERAWKNQNEDWYDFELEALDRFAMFSLIHNNVLVRREDLYKINFKPDLSLSERITPNVIVKPFFDIDLKNISLDQFTDEYCENILQLFLNWITIIFEQLFDVNLMPQDFFVTVGNRIKNGLGKLSYHVLVQNHVYFKTWWIIILLSNLESSKNVLLTGKMNKTKIGLFLKQLMVDVWSTFRFTLKTIC